MNVKHDETNTVLKTITELIKNNRISKMMLILNNFLIYYKTKDSFKNS